MSGNRIDEDDAPSESELREFVARYEVTTNAAIRRLLAVNDQYGNAVLRSAIFDELNGLMRMTKKCLLPTTKDSAPISQSALRVSPLGRQS